MDIGAFMSNLNLFDLLVVLGLFGCFLLGFIQGTIRRLLGIGSMLFSFLLAANVKDPLGDFLGDNWTQFPPEYGAMIGFLTIFVAATVAFSLTIQGTYRKAPLFQRATAVDEVIGGVLGVLQGLMLLMFVTIILDTFFLLSNFPVDPQELTFLRSFWDALNTSGTGQLLHDTVIPAVIGVASFLIPASIRVLYSNG